MSTPSEGMPGACPRCGAPHRAGQEYCLECGLRLAPAVGRLDRWRRHAWYPGDWIWPVLVFLLLAGLGALVAVLATRSSSNDTIVATPPPVTTNAGGAAPTTRAATTVAPTAPATTASRRSTQPPRQKALLSWPDRSGYTVVLQSIPTTSGKTQALQIARRALGTRLPQVGVLDSSNYSSLHPGYYVVFSGVYDSLDRAQRALAPAKSAGFTLAYARPVTQ